MQFSWFLEREWSYKIKEMHFGQRKRTSGSREMLSRLGRALSKCEKCDLFSLMHIIIYYMRDADEGLPVPKSGW